MFVCQPTYLPTGISADVLRPRRQVTKTHTDLSQLLSGKLTEWEKWESLRPERLKSNTQGKILRYLKTQRNLEFLGSQT